MQFYINTMKKLKGKMSVILLLIVGVLLCAEVIYHAIPATAQTPQPLEREAYDFDLLNVGGLQQDGEDGFVFSYYIDSLDSNIQVYTSLIEGDYLQVYLDCLEVYSYNNSMEDLDDLLSYILNNSHLNYIDNQWFQGWIWVYDSCPIYRFPIP